MSRTEVESSATDFTAAMGRLRGEFEMTLTRLKSRPSSAAVPVSAKDLTDHNATHKNNPPRASIEGMDRSASAGSSTPSIAAS